MPVSPGSKLGSYEVLSLLGAGGMGEVYRARDTRLGRVVAIKVLPAERMADEDCRRRFVQEARAASALNHPNIVTIHEIESADGIDFIVMEYVEGTTLDNVIPRRGMRLGEVLRIAVPIAEALARAHAAGIVHRDLKPANVMVGSDGVVKVLDFGLAKLVTFEPGSPDHATVSEEANASPLSRPGTIAGTAGYMSPEQAMGKKVDARSDVFSFGSVLYEMVTGRRAFAGNSTAETLAAVVRDQPKAPSEVVAGVPKELDRLIQRCLRKEPGRRFQHMGDVKVELNEIKEESDSGTAASAVPVGRSRRWWVAIGLAGVLVLVAASWYWWHPRQSELPPARVVTLTSMNGVEDAPTFSPDGEQIAFFWAGEKGDNWDIYLKMIGSSEIRRLTTDPAADTFPSWAPGGRQIAFLRGRTEDGTIRLVSPVGESDRKLSDFPAANGQLSWSPDERFLAVQRALRNDAETDADGIYLVTVESGEARRIVQVKPPGVVMAPAFSPDGRHLAYAACHDRLLSTCHVQVVPLGENAVPEGPPRRVTSHVVLSISSLTWTRDGSTIVFKSGWGGAYLYRVDARGERPVERIEVAGPWATAPATVQSRDRLAFTRSRFDADIYRFEAGRPPQAPSTPSSFPEVFPQFSPDGRRIAYESGGSDERDEIWIAASDGSSPQQMTRGPGLWQGSPRWSPDGRRIAFDSLGEDGNWDIWTMDVDGGSLRRMTQAPSNENVPTWSRDGRWIYFGSDRASTQDVWRIAATGGSEERVTHGGGSYGFESANGKTLFFQRGQGSGSVFALPLTGGPVRTVLECAPSKGFAVGPGGLYHLGCDGGPTGSPLYLLDPATGQDRLLGKLEKCQPSLGLDVSPDGKTILYAKMAGNDGSDLMMIENFR